MGCKYSVWKCKKFPILSTATTPEIVPFIWGISDRARWRINSSSGWRTFVLFFFPSSESNRTHNPISVDTANSWYNLMLKISAIVTLFSNLQNSFLQGKWFYRLWTTYSVAYYINVCGGTERLDKAPEAIKYIRVLSGHRLVQVLLLFTISIFHFDSV